MALTQFKLLKDSHRASLFPLTKPLFMKGIIKKIRIYFRKKLRKRGFFYYKSQKLDGPFEGYMIFRKEWNESWTVALKDSIERLQESDDRIHSPITVKFFSKL